MKLAILTLAVTGICFSQVDERCPGTSTDRSPTVLGSFETLKVAAREDGHQGQLSFGLTVTETGTVREARITSPGRSNGSGRIMDEIAKLRFCPAVKSSRYIAATVRFSIRTDE